MRKVRLRMKEFEKYQKIKELVDHGGNKKTCRFAIRNKCETSKSFD